MGSARGNFRISPEGLLRRIVKDAIKAVKPSELFANQFRLTGNALVAFGEEVDLGRCKNVKCVAIGKSAEAMAHEVQKKLGCDVNGIIATPIEKHFNVKGFHFLKTGHPFPDERSVKAGREVEHFVSCAQGNDLLIFLISGGGSASIFVPVDGVTLEEANQMMKVLFDHGVPIGKINLLRRHLSKLGGGRLAALAPKTRKLSLIISDVVGDDLMSIASGPTIQDTGNLKGVHDFLSENGLLDKVPRSISQALCQTSQELVKQKLNANFVRVIASNLEALNKAEEVGIEGGFSGSVMTRFLELDAQVAGELMVSIARSVELEDVPVHVPALMLFGGETTVKLAGEGIGGRNQHLVLCALRKMAQLKENNVHLEGTTIFSFGTDGKDGNSDAAGAFASLKTLEKVSGGLIEIDKYISNADSNSFFKRYGGLITTGYTDTNVMDIMGIIVK